MNPKDRMAQMMLPDWLRQQQQTVQDGPLQPGQAFPQAMFEPFKQVGNMVLQPAYAVKKAYDEPTLGNVTNAGVQVGMGTMRPGLALGSLAAGYGTAALQDMGLIGSATASDPLDPGSRARLKALQDKQAKGTALSRAEREEQNNYLTAMREAGTAKANAEAEAALAAAKSKTEQEAAGAAKKRADDTRAELKAESSRDTELKRDKRFSGSALEGVYEATGGTVGLAALAAGGAGMADRLVKGMPKSGWDYGRLALEGTGAAAMALNGPLVYDATMSPSVNPEKLAFQAYARDLPKDHPKRAEAEAYAEKQPLENPVRAAAMKEFTDPWAMGKRTGMALLEGAPMAITGANLPGAMRALGIGAAETAVDIPMSAARRAYTGAGKNANAKADAAKLQQNSAEVRQSASQAEQLAARAQADAVRERLTLDEVLRASNQRKAAQESAQGGQTRPVQSLPEPSQPAVTSTDLQPLPPLPVGNNAPNFGAQGGDWSPVVGAIDKGFGDLGKILSQTRQAPAIPPPAPAAKQSMLGARINPDWEPYSAQARAQLDSLLGQGRTFGNSGKGKDITGREILDSLDSASFGVQNVQDRMKQLRTVLTEKGINPKTMTQEQWRAVAGDIDPRIFALPLLAGGAAAGLSAKDRMAQMMMTGEPY